jgi:hypothetical protein
MAKPNLEGKIELDELLLKVKNDNANFINHLEEEETGERIETVDSLRNQMKADRTNTDRKKLQFIDEMKKGLGQEIKAKKARGVVIHKPTLKEKLIKFLASLYSKF